MRKGLKISEDVSLRMLKKNSNLVVIYTHNNSFNAEWNQTTSQKKKRFTLNHQNIKRKRTKRVLNVLNMKSERDSKSVKKNKKNIALVARTSLTFLSHIHGEKKFLEKGDLAAVH